MSESKAQLAIAATDRDVVVATPSRLFFLTNRQNLLEVLSSGLVAPFETYDKYYDDLLQQAPGRIVVGGRASASAIAAVVDDDDPGSYPVLVEVPPDRVPRSAPTFSDGSRWLAPEAIVPVAGTNVHFRSQTELDEHRLSAYENVDHDSFRYAVSADLFAAESTEDAGLLEWLRSLPRGGDLGADYRRLDRAYGASGLLGATARAFPDAVAGYVAYLNTETPPPSAGERRRWPAWLRPDSVTPTGTPRPKGAEERALVALAGVVASIDQATGFRATQVIRDAADAALAGRIPKAERGALTASFEAATSVLDTASDFVADDPRIGLSAVRGGMYALLRPDPTHLLALFDEERISDSWSALTAAALVGLMTGRRRLPVDVRIAALDAALAVETAARLTGLPLARYAFETETHQDGSSSASVRLDDGRLLLTADLPAPQLADLLAEADLDTEPAKSVALELARALGWHDCIRTTLFLPPGEHSIAAGARGKGLVFSFVGPARADRMLLAEPFRRRLQVEGEIPLELRDRLLGRLRESSDPVADGEDA